MFGRVDMYKLILLFLKKESFALEKKIGLRKYKMWQYISEVKTCKIFKMRG